MAESRSTIMVVDDNIINLLVAEEALSEEYDVIIAESGKKALGLLRTIKPTLILLDIFMPELDGYEVIKILKSTPSTRDIPVIFLTSLDGQGNELVGLRKGAVDYIAKPFSVPLLLQRIKLHIDLYNHTNHLEMLVAEKTRVIKELQSAIMQTITELIERRDGSTGGHVVRTQLFVEAMLNAVDKEPELREELGDMDLGMAVEATQLHDVGKIGIPDSILIKPGRLTDEEYAMMKMHVAIGEEAIHKATVMTGEMDFFQYAAICIAYHHEKWDGTGYPRKIKGREIPLLGRVMAIADVYDALVSSRPYKRPFTHNQSISIIANGANQHFDPNLVSILLRIEDEFSRISRNVSE